MLTVKKDPKKIKKRHVSYLLIPFSSLIIFSLGFFPFVGFLYLIRTFFWFQNLLLYFLLPLYIYLGVTIIFLSQLIISGIIIKVCHLYYQPGAYPYTTSEKNALKWMIVVSVYTPIRKMLEIFPMGRIKNFYLRLVGMKIGTNTLVGGVIKDPCVTSIGDNCTMGEYAIIYGHIHNFQTNTISIEPVTIGHNCVIGAGAIIMPGAIVEDNVTIAAGALVTKKQRLLSGHIYTGIPAKKH